MMRFICTAVLLTAFLAPNVGCGARRVTDFTIISTKNTLLVAGAQRRDRRVKGEDCVFILFGVPNMKTAIDDAIEKSGPGYDALVDGVVLMEDRVIFQCYIVEGTPLRRTDIDQLPPAKSVDPYADDADRVDTEEGNTFVPRDEDERRDSDVANSAIDDLVDGVRRKLKPAPAEPDATDDRDTAPPAPPSPPAGGTTPGVEPSVDNGMS